MPGYAGSWRTAPLPSNWATTRLRILARDGHRCTHAGEHGRCSEQATEVDHTGEADDHRDEMLRSLCHDHHAEVTKRQRREAQARMPRATRRAERHPGLA